LAEAEPDRRRLYGRRRGRPLRPGQQRLFETLLPQLAITLPRAGRLDPKTLFPAGLSAVWLEIGFGGGEHLAEQAARHPEIGFIASEVFENGVAKLLGEIDRRRLGNVRLFADDARLLIEALTPTSIGRTFILFPDPVSVLLPGMLLAQEPEDLLPFLAQGVPPSEGAFPGPRPRQPAGSGGRGRLRGIPSAGEDGALRRRPHPGVSPPRTALKTARASCQAAGFDYISRQKSHTVRDAASSGGPDRGVGPAAHFVFMDPCRFTWKRIICRSTPTRLPGLSSPRLR